MRKTFTILVVIMLAVGLILVGCSQSTQAPASTQTPGKSSTPAPTSASAPITPPAGGWPKLSFFTPPSGTQPHTVAVAWTTMAGKYLPGMQISVEPAVGAPQAVVGFLQGNGNICYSSSNIIGTEIGKYLGGKTLASGPQHLIAGTATAFHILTRADSGINSVADFKGKKILGKVAQGGAVDLTRQQILGAYGLTDNDIVLLSGNNGSHLADQFKEGVGDAAIIVLGLKDASLIDLSTTKDIKWIDLPMDKMRPIAEKTWLYPGTIPAGTYPKQNKDILALRSLGSFDVQPSTSEDVAYALTKTYHEHFDEITKMSPFAKDYSVTESLASSYLPFHPGAIKYYKEKGLWTPELEAKQQKALSKAIASVPPASSAPVTK